MTERDCLIIKTLYHYKNITKTANALYVSQPAMTARIKLLELELHVQLIERNNKGIKFTSAGEILVCYASKHLEEYKRLKEKLVDTDNDLCGTIRLVAPYLLIRSRIPAVIKAFNILYPKVRFEIMTNHSHKAIANVKNDFVHFAFIRSNNNWNEGEKLMLSSDKVCIVSVKPFRFEDLPNMVRVDYRTDSEYRQFLTRWWQYHFTVQPKTDIQVDHVDDCRGLVDQGVGYGILPAMAVENDSKLYSEFLRDGEGNLMLRHTWVMYSKSVFENKVPQVFLEFLKARAGEK